MPTTVTAPAPGTTGVDRRQDATVIDLHGWQRRHEMESRGRSMAVHPAGLRRRSADTIVAPATR
jgi:hypothetical protein